MLSSVLFCNPVLCDAMLCSVMRYVTISYVLFVKLCYDLLCYAMLLLPYCAMPCYVMLCYVLLCYALLRSAMLRYAMLCYAMFCVTDIEAWTQENVQQWLRWTARAYKLQDVDVSKFEQVDGRVLCAMSRDDLTHLVNPYNANVLLQYLSYLRKKHDGKNVIL